ncbi:hypothetical protein J6590_071292 [Homalodisca vitripennis]|nr:hypothetical protein J6590_071292 [Homalodisca vitripennis]
MTPVPPSLHIASSIGSGRAMVELITSSVQDKMCTTGFAEAACKIPNRSSLHLRDALKTDRQTYRNEIFMSLRQTRGNYVSLQSDRLQ